MLARDAEIASWKQIAQGAERAAVLEKLEKKRKQLVEDFSFVADCNLGGEFLSDEAIARLRQIADIEWQRMFNDRIGISWEELKRTGTAC